FARSQPACRPRGARASKAASFYVGISPARPVSAGGPVRQNLRRRLRAHLRGNASGSTVRLTLGCLLRAGLGLTLRRVGSGERMTVPQIPCSDARGDEIGGSKPANP